MDDLTLNELLDVEPHLGLALVLTILLVLPS